MYQALPLYFHFVKGKIIEVGESLGTMLMQMLHKSQSTLLYLFYISTCSSYTMPIYNGCFENTSSILIFLSVFPIQSTSRCCNISLFQGNSWLLGYNDMGHI